MLLYYRLISPAKHLDVAKAYSATQAKANRGDGELARLQPGQGQDAPAARTGPTRVVLARIWPIGAAGRGDVKSIAAMVREQQTAGVRGPPGRRERHQHSSAQVASGVEQLQIIFMGDNKNVLPHNQHKTVATVSFSLKQHVLNERSADKCCKRFKGMHGIIQHALL